MILYIMKMKFQNLVLLTISFTCLLFLFYVKKSFDWLLGFEEKEKVLDPPEVAIAKEFEQLQSGWRGPAAYPNIPVMIWWSPFTGDDGLQQCGDFQCFVTNERGHRRHPSTRTIFFYGTEFKPYDLPLPRLAGEDWALLHEESPKNNAIFSHAPVMELFNHTATFRQHSHFPLTTQYLEGAASLASPRYLVPLQEKNRLQAEAGLAPVAYVQSGCDTPSQRDSWVREFMKHIAVDSYGACLNNKQLPEDLQGSEQFESERFLHFLAQYKFVISFENAVCDDYVTEKLWRALAVGSVPVYLGAPNVEDLLPHKNAAIVVTKFPSPEAVATFVKSVNSDDTLYQTFLQHKSGESRKDEALIENDLLLDLLERRRWGVSSQQQRTQGNFVAHFQCHVCEKVARNLKFSNLGFRPLPFDASVEHYGCPAPVSPLTGEMDRKSWWTDIWLRSQNEAIVVNKFASENIAINSTLFYQETFKLMEDKGEK